MVSGSGIPALQFVFLALLLFVVVFAALAKKLKTPYPIVLVIAGLLLGFLPGIPKMSLNPDLIFVVVLPPLIYSAAWQTSWREFKFHLVSILLLAFGLVGFTVWGVAEFSYRFITALDSSTTNFRQVVRRLYGPKREFCSRWGGATHAAILRPTA